MVGQVLSHHKQFQAVGIEAPRFNAYFLSRDADHRRLSILPAKRSVPEPRNEDVLSLQLSAAPEQVGLQERGDTSERTSTSVSLVVHSGFVSGKNRYPAAIGSGERRHVYDSTATQLAAGLLCEQTCGALGGSTVHFTVALLCARLTSLLATHEKTAPLSFQDWQLRLLQELLSEDRGEDVSVAAVATRCGLSSCHFSRLFKATYGISLHRYLTNQRVKLAQQHLARTDQPISQIALDCGFADQSCFTRRFTSVAGLPPAMWRKRFRASEPGQHQTAASPLSLAEWSSN